MADALVRVIAGAAKGRRLRAPKDRLTRPMTDRVKEAIFSSLGAAVVDASVLDLYAGSGSLGLEALSRGAAQAVFVESRREAIRVLEANLDAVGLGGEIAPVRVEDYAGAPGIEFDLVFVDPPYDLPLPSVLAVLERLVGRLGQEATVVVHRRHGSGDVLGPEGLTVVDRRRYGDAEITRLVRETQR